MNIAFYNGVSGMMAYQNGLDVIGHNMANVSTAGYKPSRATFRDLLYTEMYTNGEQVNRTGHGVKVQSTDLLYGQGNLSQTGQPLDFALIGEGFFAVDRGDHIEYTRNGAFDISVEGSKGYLVTADGGYVLDSRGRRIALPRAEGSNLFSLDELPETLGIYTFPNPYGLEPTDGSCFLETEISGAPEAIRQDDENAPQLKSSALEMSGVDLADEMVDVIITQKAFQFSAKMVQTADEIEEIVNNLR